MPSQKPPRPELARKMDLTDAISLGLGAIVGGGVFVALGPAADLAGPALLVALLIAGGVALINGLASARLAGAFPEAGGVYAYARRLVHPMAGYLAGWLFLVSKIASAAALAGAFAAYIAPNAPPVVGKVIAVGIVIALTALNMAGVRASLRINGALVALKVGALGLFLGLALPMVRKANMVPFLPHGWGGVGRAAAVLFFAYTGYARVATVAEEVKDPETTIPRAVVLSLLLSIALYLAVGLAAVGVAGPLFSGKDIAGHIDNAPLLVPAAFTALPGIAMGAVTVGAVVAAASILLALLWGLSRTAFAMARNGDLPAPLMTLLPDGGAPWVALIVVGTAVAMLAAVGSVPALITSSAFSVLLYYAGANACALILNRDTPLRKAFYWIGLGACLALAASLPPAAIRSGLALAVIGLALYPLRRVWRA